MIDHDNFQVHKLQLDQ